MTMFDMATMLSKEELQELKDFIEDLIKEIDENEELEDGTQSD